MDLEGSGRGLFLCIASAFVWKWNSGPPENGSYFQQHIRDVRFGAVKWTHFSNLTNYLFQGDVSL